jgi:curved DNA-binding protein CbpA
MTHYAALGVPGDADAETIHAAYRARARQYHPDAGAGSSPGKFREIVEAYETLSDPARRRAYDQSLRAEAARIRRPEVVVEPLAGPRPFPSARERYQWAGPVNTARGWMLEQWFDEVTRLLDDEFFSERWFGSW